MGEWTLEKYLAAVEIADEIVDQVTSFKIADPWTPTFKACCMFFYIARTGQPIWDRISLAFRKKITFQECTQMSYNWRRGKRWDGHHFTLQISEDELENIVELTLFCMVGAGEIRCTQAEDTGEIDPSKFMKAV
jgi:hypothetical protein